MSEYFPKPFNSHLGDSIKVKIVVKVIMVKVIMQQKQTLKIFHRFIFQVLH